MKTIKNGLLILLVSIITFALAVMISKVFNVIVVSQTIGVIALISAIISLLIIAWGIIVLITNWDYYKSELKHKKLNKIENINNQKKLVKIAMNEDFAIRKAALYKIENQELLVKIVKNKNYKDRSIPIKKLNSEKWQDLFVDLAKNDEDFWVREAAVEKLTDQNLISNISKNDPEPQVRKAAVKKLTAQDLLANIYQNDDDNYVRRTAIEKLDPEKWQDLLIKIAKKDTDYWNRVTAVEKLDPEKWQDLLIDFVKNETNDIGKAAIDKINLLENLSVIFDILIENGKSVKSYKGDDFYNRHRDYFGKLLEILNKGIEKLDSEKWKNLLDYINQTKIPYFVSTIEYSTADHSPERYRAEDNIVSYLNNLIEILKIKVQGRLYPEKEQSFIYDMVKSNGDENFRSHMIRNLYLEQWQPLFADLAKNDEYFDVRAEAVKKLDSSKWQDLLVDIAKNDQSFYVRAITVKKIIDQNILVDVARNDEDCRIWEEVFDRITDQKLLAEISKNYKTSFVRTKAIERLDVDKWQDLLTDIAKNDDNQNICETVIDKLRDKKALFDIAKNAKKKSIRRLAKQKRNNDL